MGCTEQDAKNAMVRIVAVNGGIELDTRQVIAGRGGYLHREESCLQQFVRGKAREFRSLRRVISRDEREHIKELIISAAR
jgi:predicted RNA-binding protein YlxR (DUF448 family)